MQQTASPLAFMDTQGGSAVPNDGRQFSALCLNLAYTAEDSEAQTFFINFAGHWDTQALSTRLSDELPRFCSIIIFR